MKTSPTPQPPRLAQRLFEWYCRQSSIEDLQGDLDELFLLDIQRMSPAKAKLSYWRHMLSLIFSYAVKKRKQTGSIHPMSANSVNFAMLGNYFLIATRSLGKHKFFTIINVLGLAIGMSVSVIYISLLSYLWTYDDFHTNKARIYRVISTGDDGQYIDELASAPGPLKEKMLDHAARIEDIARIRSNFSGNAIYMNQEIPLRGYYVDPSFLSIFTFPLLKGNAVTALTKPNSLVITESAAKKIFNTEDAFGKVITMGSFGDFEITGILRDHPLNSHMNFEVLGSYATLETSANTALLPKNPWQNIRNSYVYLLLEQNPVGYEETVSRIENYLASVTEEVYANDKNFKATFELQALNDIVPGKDMHNQIGPDWDLAGLSIFFALTLLILLPACFNYTNISISRALKRAKEIGLRKAMGGQRSQIFTQFILETVIISLIALVGAYGIFMLVRDEFLTILVPNHGLELLSNPLTLFYFVVFAILVGVLAGIVPAIYFSKLNPIESLKSSFQPKGRKAGSLGLRKGLVILQFALSFGFIMSVVVAIQLHRTSLSYDFGFDRNDIVTVNLQGVDPENFRNEFSKLSSVHSLAMSSHVLGTSGTDAVVVVENDGQDSTEVFTMSADGNYLSTLGLQLVAGKTFPEDFAAGKGTIIVNEEFVKHFKLARPADAINKVYTLGDGMEVRIVGVMKDFHYMDLQHPVKSFFFRCDPAQFNYANLKVTSGDRFSLLTPMETSWKTFAGHRKFTAHFLDDQIEDAYHFHYSMIKMCGFMGMLAISISCLGLLGMVVFTVENRMKEVGVRKVMGASSGTIAALLSFDFVKLMLIGSAIAIPFTWLFFEKVYLTVQFYTIHVGISDVLISLGLILLLGLTTILSQTLKAAQANPVDTLRYE